MIDKILAMLNVEPKFLDVIEEKIEIVKQDRFEIAIICVF